MNSSPSTFAANPYTNPTSEFLRSGSIIAKLAFLLFVLFGFIIVLHICLYIIYYFYLPTGTVKLLNGMSNGRELLVFHRDSSTALPRSVNESNGIEFTWSVFFYIDDMTYNEGKYRCIFYKGNEANGATGVGDTEQQGLNFPNNAPGLYIAPNKNDLIIIMNTFKVINEEIPIHDIPLNKWVNVVIRLQNEILDIYVNGSVVKSHTLHGVPKQNFYDVYVAPNGGFSGYVSNLWYYSRALSAAEIMALATNGPNTKLVSGDHSGLDVKNSDYLALRWYF